MVSSTALSILTLLSSSTAAVAQVFTREDGKCGLVDGVEAGCEHIPPFPTCCQENGHCGWDCDGSKTGFHSSIYFLSGERALETGTDPEQTVKSSTRTMDKQISPFSLHHRDGLQGCVNAASWLPLAAGREFTQPGVHLIAAHLSGLGKILLKCI